MRDEIHCQLRPDKQPWLPLGFSFLSGLPEAARRRRLLMPIQAYVDDSGCKGDTRHFVLAGLVSSAESWAAFSDDWRACLDDYPRIKVFKMREAVKCSGQFYYMSADQRDEMLLRLARIINKYVLFSTHSIIDLEAHSKSWATIPKPMNDPYFHPFHNTILATCFTLWDAEWRERFEIIFDEQLVSGLRAKEWYPVVKLVVKHREPEAVAIMPVEPMFKKDDEFLPIQAADLFAWCLRKAADSGGECGFEWLLDEMKDVRPTEYSQYYDRQRMDSVMEETDRMLRNGEIPQEILRAAKDKFTRK